MAKFAKINTKILKADLDKFAKIYSQTVASKASEELEKIAKEAIQKFYNDYSPDYYIRTYNFARSIVPFTSTGHNGLYRGGIYITTQQMNNYQFGHWSTSAILSNSWLKGAHGNKFLGSRKGVIEGKTRPDDYVRKITYTRNFKRNISSLGIQAASSANYAMLHFK